MFADQVQFALKKQFDLDFFKGDLQPPITFFHPFGPKRGCNPQNGKINKYFLVKFSD